jgi:hypothetical protein
MSIRRTNQLWSVSHEHTLFLDFLKLFVNMRLAISFAGRKKTHFLDLRIKNYGCLKFQGEVWAGRACVGTNEEELTTCAKFWGQEVGGRRQGEYKKGGPTQERSAATDCSPTSGRPFPGDRWMVSGRSVGNRGPQRAATSSCLPAAGRRLDSWAQSFVFGFFFCSFF